MFRTLKNLDKKICEDFSYTCTSIFLYLPGKCPWPHYFQRSCFTCYHNNIMQIRQYFMALVGSSGNNYPNIYYNVTRLTVANVVYV